MVQYDKGKCEMLWEHIGMTPNPVRERSLSEVAERMKQGDGETEGTKANMCKGEHGMFKELRVGDCVWG